MENWTWQALSPPRGNCNGGNDLQIDGGVKNSSRNPRLRLEERSRRGHLGFARKMDDFPRSKRSSEGYFGIVKRREAELNYSLRIYFTHRPRWGCSSTTSSARCWSGTRKPPSPVPGATWSAGSSSQTCPDGSLGTLDPRCTSGCPRSGCACPFCASRTPAR